MTFYKLVGKTIVRTDDHMDWLEWAGKADSHVELTETADYHVSTIFLNTNLGFAGRDAFFETMITCRDGFFARVEEAQQLDQMQLRYSTYDEAAEGHAAVVEYLDRRLAEAVSKAIESSSRRR